MSVSALPNSFSSFVLFARSSTASKAFLSYVLLYLAGIFTHLLWNGSGFVPPSGQLRSIHSQVNDHTPQTHYDAFNLSDMSGSHPHIVSQLHRSSVPVLPQPNRPRQLSTTFDILRLTNVLPKPKVSFDLSTSSLITPLLCLIIVFGSFAVAQNIRRLIGFRAFSRQNACFPMRIAPFSSKLQRYFEVSKIDANLLDDYVQKKYQNNGLTHGLATVLTKRVKAVLTIEPENFQAVLATRFDDWERPKFRAGAAKPFLKTGILTLVSSFATHLGLLPLLACLFWLRVVFRLTMLF